MFAAASLSLSMECTQTSAKSALPESHGSSKVLGMRQHDEIVAMQRTIQQFDGEMGSMRKPNN